jgi:hypothetical protein
MRGIWRILQLLLITLLKIEILSIRKHADIKSKNASRGNTRRFRDVKARVFTREKGKIRDTVNEHDGQVT